jgi:hypothetical protein
MKKAIVILAVMALSGCANLKFQWAASYQTDNLAADVAAARAAQLPSKPQRNSDEVAWIKNTLGYLVANPTGFLTDLASTPRIPIVYEVCGNVATKAAVVHDYLYTSGRESRAIADAVLREAAALAGVSWWQCWAMWAGVRVGGGSHYTSTPAGSPVAAAG